MHPNHILEVGRRDLAATRLLGEPLPTLAPGAVRLEVERLALTANTVTYALTGDLLGYWQFYPAPDADWGRVPAMGWARIVESTRPELAVGSRYYGWWPMARFVDVDAEPNGRGFRDVGAHREGHAPVYRQALDTAADPLHEPGRDAEDRHALLRGLFQTAFLADDALAEQEPILVVAVKVPFERLGGRVGAVQIVAQNRRQRAAHLLNVELTALHSVQVRRRPLDLGVGISGRVDVNALLHAQHAVQASRDVVEESQNRFLNLL